MYLHVLIGEGNGTPLQYSCLENPLDGGAWCAAVHGVAKSRRRLRDFTLIFTFMHWRRKWQLTPVFQPGESQGWQSLVGCCLWGRTELDTTEATQQQQYMLLLLHIFCHLHLHSILIPSRNLPAATYLYPLLDHIIELWLFDITLFQLCNFKCLLHYFLIVEQF